MTDDTTTPGTASGVAVVDRRTARRLAIAEQQRLDADAELERRGRAALQELDLAEARLAAEQRRRDVRRRQVLGRRSARKGRRAARRVAVRTAVPRVAERALFVGPILFPMAVAWIGQMQYARTILGWPLAGAVVFAAGFELSTVYVARLDWKARGGGDNAVVFRAATWMFAALAATMNYWHAADPGLRPNGEAVSYGAMSIAGVVLWELLSTYRHRRRLRDAGTLSPRRPRFGLARWVWFPRVTHLARLLALRDGHTLTGQAWQAALDAATRRGSVRAAIADLRGHPQVALLCSGCDQPRAETSDETTSGQGGETVVETTGETSRQTVEATLVETSGRTEFATAHEMSAETGLGDEIETYVETVVTPETFPVVAIVETGAAPARYRGNGHRVLESTAERDGPGEGVGEVSAGDRRAARSGRGVSRRPAGLKGKMIRYVDRQRRAGATVTGAELDRRFGTSNYGSRILRELDAQHSNPRE